MNKIEHENRKLIKLLSDLEYKACTLNVENLYEVYSFINEAYVFKHTMTMILSRMSSEEIRQEIFRK